MSERYQRHSLIPDWQQEKLQDAHVIIVGVGAIGNEVARNVTMAGVGHLTLCDPDVVSESNLSRCALFSLNSLGQKKAIAAAETLSIINPLTQIDIVPKDLASGIGLATLRDADLVMSCLDSRSARLQLAGRCNLVQTPVIDGGTSEWKGEIRPFLDVDGPCYGCSLSAHERSIVDQAWSCLDTLSEENIGTNIFLSVLVGGWMSTIAIRYLMGLELDSTGLYIDVSNKQSQPITLRRSKECPLHFNIPKSQRLPINNQATIESLMSYVEGGIPLAWLPVMYGRKCFACGYQEDISGIPIQASCQKCNSMMIPETTLDLSLLPLTIKLSDCGIPTREIFAVQKAEEFCYYELSD